MWMLAFFSLYEETERKEKKEKKIMCWDRKFVRVLESDIKGKFRNQEEEE